MAATALQPTPTALPDVVVPPVAEQRVVPAELSRLVPWISDPPDRIHVESGDLIAAIWEHHEETGRAFASLPWVLDGADGWDLWTLMTLSAIALVDPELSVAVLRWPWVGHDMNSHNEQLLEDFHRNIVARDVGLARLIADIRIEESEEFEADHWSMVHLFAWQASNYIELSRQLAAAPWLSDGATRSELKLVEGIVRDPDTAALLLEITSEFDEDIGDVELDTLQDLQNVAGVSAAAAATAAEFMGPDLDELDNYFVEGLSSLSARTPDRLHELAGRSWFLDGIDREEAAFITVLRNADELSPRLFTALIGSYHVRSAEVWLPLAGETTIWVFQNEPFPPDDRILEEIETAARIIEDFMSAPFPVSNIISLVLVFPPGAEQGVGPGVHGGTFNLYSRNGQQPVPREVISHETAHYYFTAYIGEQWLTEGGAELMEAYIDDVEGRRGLDFARKEALSNYYSTCVEQGIDNIRQLNYRQSHGDSNPSGCGYALGSHFLLSLYEVMGRDGLASALRHFHEIKPRGQQPTDDEIYDAFAANTPAEAFGEFQRMFDELYGPPLGIPEIRSKDDHGNDPESATALPVGQTVLGELEHGVDRDFFRFEAGAGQKYQIEVNNAALNPERVLVLGPDGSIEEAAKSRITTSFGTRILWRATISGDYYVALEAGFNQTGPYSLLITPVATSVDDHGDTANTATPISLGETVEASLDSFFDYDNFVLQVQEGDSYRAVVENLTEGHSRVRLVPVGGMSPPAVLIAEWGRRGAENLWTATATGKLHVVVESPQDDVLDYTLTVETE